MEKLIINEQGISFVRVNEERLKRLGLFKRLLCGISDKYRDKFIDVEPLDSIYVGKGTYELSLNLQKMIGQEVKIKSI